MTIEHRPGWLHPIFIDLSGHPVIVIGGGTVAERKIETLIEAGARVSVVSPETTDLIARWAETNRVVLERRPYRTGDLRGFRLAYAATSDAVVNRAVCEEARAEGSATARTEGRTGPRRRAVSDAGVGEVSGPGNDAG